MQNITKYLVLNFLILKSIAFSYELAVCSQFRNEAPYLREWIEYHQMVGVEHFWLYNDASTDQWKSVLKPYIDIGLVEVFDAQCEKFYNAHSHIRRQELSFSDGIRRGQGKTKWLALIDVDEALVPKEGEDVAKTLNKYFSHADAVYLNWRNFGTSKITIPLGEPIFDKLIRCSSRNHPRNYIGKTILRPEACLREQINYVHSFPLKKGKVYVRGNGKLTKVKKGLYQTDRKIHDEHLWINHYGLRDENYFHNYRLKRVNPGYGGGEKLLWEHYHCFLKYKCLHVHNIIRKNKHRIPNNIWDEKRSYLKR